MTEATPTDDSQAADGPADGKPAPAPGLPAMYETVAILSAGLHGGLRFTPADRFEGAAVLNAVIVAAAEFPEAALHYPLVFSARDGKHSAHAITGHTAGRNGFVDGDGRWRAGAYVPAYVRRYPFILVEDSEQDRLTLAADLKSRWFGNDKGQPLFEDGKPSEAAENAFNFCTGYHTQLIETDRLIGRIAEAAP